MSAPVTYQGHGLSSASGIMFVLACELREIAVLVFRIARLGALLDDHLDGLALVFVEQFVHRAHRGRANPGSTSRASALHEEQDDDADDHDPDQGFDHVSAIMLPCRRRTWWVSISGSSRRAWPARGPTRSARGSCCATRLANLSRWIPWSGRRGSGSRTCRRAWEFRRASAP